MNEFYQALEKVKFNLAPGLYDILADCNKQEAREIIEVSLTSVYTKELDWLYCYL